MKRPNRRRPRHAKPPQARQTVTAILIISFFIAALLIGASHKIGGSANEAKHLVWQASAPASPLGGGAERKRNAPTVTTARPGVTESVTTLPLDEPLEGGATGAGRVDPGVSETPTPASSAPQQRDRPAIEAMQSAVVEAQQARERRIAVWRIDTYLAHKNSPMQGCGEFYIQNQERTGIPGSLSAGIAEAESTNGMRCYQHPSGDGDFSFNAWGMIGWEYRNGFSSWQEGIAANFDFLMRWHGPGAGRPIPQTIHDCNGYCEGNTTSQTVDDVQWQINAYEPPEGI